MLNNYSVPYEIIEGKCTYKSAVVCNITTLNATFNFSPWVKVIM